MLFPQRWRSVGQEYLPGVFLQKTPWRVAIPLTRVSEPPIYERRPSLSLGLVFHQILSIALSLRISRPRLADISVRLTALMSPGPLIVRVQRNLARRDRG